MNTPIVNRLTTPVTRDSSHGREPSAPPRAPAEPRAADPTAVALRGRPPGEDDPAAFAGYHVLGVAGRGGMGVVYEAVQLDPPRAVALKVLAPRLRADPAAVARFHTEVRVAARLHHTNIVPVLATVSGPSGPVAYAMPLVRGESLAAALRPAGSVSAPPDGSATRAGRAAHVQAVVEWVRQAAEAVAAAHAAGVVHRDVKPGNLLLEYDRSGRPHVWLHDFGLAVEAAGETDPAAVGTPGYQSPELTAGGTAAHRPPVDVYALGVTLAELVTRTRRSDGGPVPGGRAVPRELRRVIAKATAADPAGRYGSAAELADDLARYLAGFPVAAGRPVWGRRICLWATRHRRPVAAAVGGLLVAAAVGAGLLVRAYDAERAARSAATDARKAVAAYTLTVDDILYATPAGWTPIALLEQAVRVQELHLRVDPADLFATRHLAHASWRLARVYQRLGRHSEAVPLTARAIELYGRVAAANPHDPVHRLDVARTYSIHAVSLRPADPEAALAADAAAHRTTRELLAEFPADPRVRDAAATYLTVYGQALVAAGRPAEAEAYYRQAAAEADRVWADHPHQWKLASPAMHARLRLSQLLAARGRTEEAVAENAAALALCDGLVARAALPAADTGRIDLLTFRVARAELLTNRAEWLVATGAEAAGVAAELDAAALLVAADHSDHKGAEAWAAPHVRAWVAYRAGRPAEAAAAGREYERLLATAPPTADRAVRQSRWYADGPAGRDLGKAEAFAREAVRLAADDPAAWQALGAALYRLGRLADAEAALARVSASPSRTVALVRAAITARSGRANEACWLLAGAAVEPVPCELCTPEWEAEVGRALAGGRD
ncbi:MAG: serine/threonine-protein kinase [Gemmataceae bacterium]